tara:strand:- start:21002 stop:22705 length:1704 start_codon:yes stop_codon:yes gene_type:complete
MKKTFILVIHILVIQFLHAQSFNGFALYNAQGSNTTYLIDENQQIAHTWNMNTECNYAVALKKNGNLIRGTKANTSIFSNGNIAAGGGKVQEIAPDGSIVWSFDYVSNDYVSHHDLTLIGDNVLLTAYEKKSAAELNAAGFNNANSEKWPTHFIELEPDGNGGATIVWEWHIWDHMCQDIDPSLPNYTSNIADHPELIDINMIQGGGGPGGGGPGGGGGDWFHVNGVDYNEELDQIVFSSRFASEIYIIDHSTTTAEAASHSGGNSGMGGDILYRWGNPSNYNMPGPQIIDNAVHDSRWITDDGRPNGGFLQIFNNSGVSNNQSAVDGIETPWDPTTNTYLRTPGQAFAPLSYTTRYACAYSSSGQSASDRMSNGNIFVNASGGQGGAGVMYEVDSLGNIVWGPYQAGSQKGFRYECDYPGIIALEPYMNNTSTTSCFTPVTESWDCDGQGNCFDPGTGNGQYSSLNICNNACVQTSIQEIENQLFLYPNPTNNGIFNVRLGFSTFNTATVEVFNLIGQQIFHNHRIKFSANSSIKINLADYLEGVYFVTVKTDKGNIYKSKVSYIK